MTTKAARAATEEDALEQVLKNPPPGWVNPHGSGRENPAADGLSWQVEVRSGLADKLNGIVSAQRPIADRIRQMLRVSEARRDDLLSADYRRRLDNIEPACRRNEELLKFCAPWIGFGVKSLERKLREAEGALIPVQAEASEYDGARQLVLAAAPDASAREALEKALAPPARSIAAKLGAARQAIDVARQARDANLEAIGAAQAKLARLVA